MSSSDAYENGKNGKSFWGQAYTSPFEGIAHADDEAARAAANDASTSTIPYYRPAPTNVSVCSDGGGTSSGDAGTVTSTLIGWIVAIIVLGGIFGGGDKKDSMSTTRTAAAHDATTTTALSGRQATANREASIRGGRGRNERRHPGPYCI